MYLLPSSVAQGFGHTSMRARDRQSSPRRMPQPQGDHEELRLRAPDDGTAPNYLLLL